MKTALSESYQEIKKLIIEQKANLVNNSPLYEAMSNNFEELQIIEYWLCRAEGIINGQQLTEKLKKCDYKDWYQILSELEAFYLLSNNMGMDVIGYEQSPPCISGTSDFQIKRGNESVYFEVKFKASEVLQTTIPEKFNSFLDKIEEEHENKYRITLLETENSKDRKKYPKYQELFSKYLMLPENLNIVEKKIKEYLKTQDRKHPSCCVSINTDTETINIKFLVTSKDNSERSSHCRPDDVDDIKSWLFDDADGKTPMVKDVTLKKGSDYLICFIPSWRNLNETFYNYVTFLFSDIQILKTNFAVSKDTNLRQLSGIILVRERGGVLTNDYVVVSNASVTPKINDWIEM